MRRFSAEKYRLYRAAGKVLGRPRREDIFQLVAPGGIGAEIGVFRGEFTPRIIERTKPRELHLIDGWWKVYSERFPDWGEYTEHGQLTTRKAWREAHESIQSVGADEITRFHVGDDVEILAGFALGYFDWVYLDTSHQYEHTLRELQVLGPRIAPAGRILGDDWHDDPEHEHGGVARAAREFVEDGEWELVRVDRVFGQWGMHRTSGRAESTTHEQPVAGRGPTRRTKQGSPKA